MRISDRKGDTMAWKFSGDKAVYFQIMEEIKLRIITGMYPAGSRLPSVRDLAEEARVNPNTMQKAMTELEREDMIVSQRTAGKYVTYDTDKILSEKKRMAKEQTESYISSMKKLGFTENEIIGIIKERNS